MEASTGRIVAATLTSKDVDDASQAGPLLDQAVGAVASFTGNGGHDQDRVYGPELTEKLSVHIIRQNRNKMPAGKTSTCTFRWFLIPTGFVV